MKLPIVIVSDGVGVPVRAYPCDAGLDLQAAADLVLRPHQRGKVSTGLRVQIPPGYVGMIVPRSGLAAEHGITHLDAPGIIDAGYRGEVHLLLYNSDLQQTFSIASGDRIGQLLVVPCAAVEPAVVDELDRSARGVHGLGSTGLR